MRLWKHKHKQSINSTRLTLHEIMETQTQTIMETQTINLA